MLLPGWGLMSPYWGRLGVDDIGDRIVERLNQFNVRTEHVARIEGGRSPMGTILLAPDGERTALGFIGQDLGEDAGWLPLELLDGVSGVLADYSWWQGAKALFEGARRRGDRFGSRCRCRRPLMRCRSFWPCLIIWSSHRSASGRLTDCARLEDAILKADGMCRGTVSATDGARGFFWCHDGQVRHVPAFEIEAIDTNGAGDIFHGAFTLGLAENMRIEDAARFASAAAALKCASGSGWESIPDRSEVETLINGGRK